MDLISAPLRLPALRLDGDLMHTPTRPLRLDNVTESLRCPRRGNASAPSSPHRVQPVPVAVGSKIRSRGRLKCRPTLLPQHGPPLPMPRPPLAQAQPLPAAPGPAPRPQAPHGAGGWTGTPTSA
ncbi:hypothetical protein HaLaN_29171 [Haematococcus lacustris]|uniref:Uncharacterized protein n=1 Tax=Haematococcus lacustris TaxID=44745 RepID=A0A6A0AEQ1_HAELA|nr:hypothetical protein HaLaN_29171 [Haematococcus lacustris]